MCEGVILYLETSCGKQSILVLFRDCFSRRMSEYLFALQTWVNPTNNFPHCAQQRKSI